MIAFAIPGMYYEKVYSKVYLLSFLCMFTLYATPVKKTCCISERIFKEK